MRPSSGEGRIFFVSLLRAPETARERRLTDRVALPRSGIASRAARATDNVIALRIVIHITAGTRWKLSPATFEDPLNCYCGCCVFCCRLVANGSCTTRRLPYAGGKENSEENKGYGCELNSAQTHQTSPFWSR